MDKIPPNLIIAALAELDRRMLINPAGDQIQISVTAICDLIANPPPMLRGYWQPAKP